LQAIVLDIACIPDDLSPGALGFSRMRRPTALAGSFQCSRAKFSVTIGSLPFFVVPASLTG